MKKGFTLVELLGVIVILSILIVIAMPNIINSIKSANKKTDAYTATLIYQAVDKHIAHSSLYKEEKGNVYCIAIDKIVSEGYLEENISYGGAENIEDSMSVKATYGNKWNYKIVKTNQCTSNVEKICTKTTFIADPDEFTVGDAYNCKVNSTQTYKFYILSIDSNKISLIAEKNLKDDGTLTTDETSLSGWSTTSDNSVGPTNAYMYLSAYTIDWTNLSPIRRLSYIDSKVNNYGYKSINIVRINNNYVTKIYSRANTENTYNNLVARLPLKSELENVGCDNTSESCPTWIYENIGNSSDGGYWLANSANDATNAEIITSTGRIDDVAVTNTSTGVRPVIEVYKSDLEQ